MSLSIASTGAATALAALSPHPHGHGHQKGLDFNPDSSGTPAAQQSTGSTQNLFGSLLSSLEQVIGVQPAANSSAQKAATEQTGTEPASTASTLGKAATSVLSTVGSALKLFA